jgi:hypothetical protein
MIALLPASTRTCHDDAALVETTSGLARRAGIKFVVEYHGEAVGFLDTLRLSARRQGPPRVHQRECARIHPANTTCSEMVAVQGFLHPLCPPGPALHTAEHDS